MGTEQVLFVLTIVYKVPVYVCKLQLLVVYSKKLHSNHNSPADTLTEPGIPLQHSSLSPMFLFRNRIRWIRK
jgi:hypothetical protein